MQTKYFKLTLGYMHSTANQLPGLKRLGVADLPLVLLHLQA